MNKETKKIKEELENLAEIEVRKIVKKFNQYVDFDESKIDFMEMSFMQGFYCGYKKIYDKIIVFKNVNPKDI